MAISVKSKFAGFLRGLIGRADHRAPARPVAPTAPALAPVPAKTSTPSRPAHAHAPAPVLSTATAPGGSRADEIEVPLASVVASLPLDLRAKLMSPPPAGQTIHLQAEKVISQLAFGAVKISFGELRQLAPGIFVNSGGEQDNKLISLPLQEILPRLNPALLARRTAKKIEVADEIVGPFADRGRGFSFTTQPLKGPVAQPAQPPPAPEPAPSTPITFASPPPRQVSPPNASQFPARSITPAAPTGTTNGNGHSHPPVTPLPTRSVTPANGNGNGNGHSNGNGSKPALPPGLRLGSLNGNGNGHVRAETPAPMRMAPLVPAPTESPVPGSASVQPTISAVLGDLCENWPDEIKGEISRGSLARLNVPLDGSVILPGLKRGRVMMTWKQIRLLAQPGSAPSPKDNLELELPLKVLAPLFLAAQKPPDRAQTKASVSAEIPDLFFGFPQPAAPPAVIAPVIPPLPRPMQSKPGEINPEIKPLEMRQAGPKPQDTNFYVWGEKGEAPQADELALRRGELPQTDFMSRQAHPKEVVARAAAIPGVAGAVVAMQDGLCVASQIPAELSGDTLAAFLPQIFERVNQSTRELRMGTLNNVSFTVGNVPWKIFRVNAVYFAAFGRAGEQLPTTQLAQLAAELDRKKQQ